MKFRQGLVQFSEFCWIIKSVSLIVQLSFSVILLFIKSMFTLKIIVLHYFKIFKKFTKMAFKCEEVHFSRNFETLLPSFATSTLRK